MSAASGNKQTDMKKNRIHIWAVALLGGILLGAVACTPEALCPGPGEDGLERVPVTLSLSVAPAEDGTPGTKAVQDPDDGASVSDQIQNFVVLQFDGQGSEAPLVGGQLYVDHYPLTAADKVSLIAGTDQTVVVLANTFGSVGITPSTTLGEFLETGFTTIYGLDGLLVHDDYLRMSGSACVASVTGSTVLDLPLKRNCAKVVVHVTNAAFAADPAVTLSGIQLEGLNAKYYYWTDVAAGLAPLTFTDPYVARYRFDDEVRPFTQNDGTEATYTFYVPVNLRGTNDSQYQYSKGNCAPKGATRLRLYGTYGPDAAPVTYTYYLGGNLTNDFNIRPNHKYTYDITVSAKGDPYYDYRIEDQEERCFTTDANCYMLCPPSVSGQSRIYSFPVRRAAVFWNPEGENGGVYGGSTLSPYDGFLLDAQTTWEAEILWSDFDMSDYLEGESKFLAVDHGTGFAPGHAQPYIKVRVPAGMKGNVVVAMKVGGSILWSWHLWITDYEPDRHVAKVEGKYVYQVGGGEVHRYNNALWNTAPTDDAVGYADGFAMDRNLGAMVTRYADLSKGSLGMYYQFGRKDPFADRDQKNNAGRIYVGGTSSEGVLGNNRREVIAANAAGKNVRYSVIHPMLFLAAGYYNWTAASDDLGDGGNASCLWNDRKWKHADNLPELERKKSIYDPCPPGWKVPVSGTWAGLNVANDDNREAGTYTTVWADNGRYYYPEGYVNREATGSIYFPANGYLNESSGNMTVVGSRGMFWSATSKSNREGYLFDFRSGEVLPAAYWYNRSNGYQIRCVKE